MGQWATGRKPIRHGCSLECQVVVQVVDDLTFGSGEPSSLLPQDPADVAVVEFPDERQAGQTGEPVAVQDCSPELRRVAVILDQWMASSGADQEQDEVPGWERKEPVGLEPACLEEADPSVADELV